MGGISQAEGITAQALSSLGLPTTVADTYLRRNAGDTAYEAYTPQQVANEVNPLLTGRRNAVINGDFGVWQRADTQATNGYGSDDRWSNGHVGSTKSNTKTAFTVGQTDVPGNPVNYSKTAVTTAVGAGNYTKKEQRIEGVHTFAGETVTLSFYAKADTTRSIAIDFLQNFGTGGAPSAEVSGIGAQQFALTASWQKFTATVSITSITGKTIGTNGDDYLSLTFWFDAGSDFNARTGSLGNQSGTFDLAQVQLEAGSVATTFEKRSIGEEDLLCKRYYHKLQLPDHVNFFGLSNTTTDAVAVVKFAPSMRAAPAVVLPTAGQGVGEVSFLTPAVAYPATTGTHTILSINNNSFRIVGSSYVGLSALAVSPFYSNGATAVELSAEL